MLTVGLDIGSRSSKAVVLEDGRVIADIICEATLRLTDRARNVFEAVIGKAGIDRGAVDYIVATGYGRVLAPFAQQTVTEITCHAKGIHTLHSTVRTVVDIGGQDSKVIKLNAGGQVVDFAMNDRCAAGTGKFLEVTSRAMELSLEDFSRLYFESANPRKISSMCAVFAESEVISLLAEGAKDRDIVAGLILAVARRVANMAKRHAIGPDFAFTGGVAKNAAVLAALETEIGHPFLKFTFDPQLIGAYGAAVIAAEHLRPAVTVSSIPAGKKKL